MRGGLGGWRGAMGIKAEMTAERVCAESVQRGGRRAAISNRRPGEVAQRGDDRVCGARDEQVKIRGYRIELGEVEAALREQSGVKEAVAIAWVKESGDKQLVGYVVGEKGAKLTAAGLREGVGKKLPNTWCRWWWCLLEELPLTANGKVDRGKLPGPEEALGERGGEYVGPRDATEAILAEVWADALGLERVGMEENFSH